MRTSISNTSPKRSNWKAGLALFGVLLVILVIVIPLALMNADDRNRPPASDERRIAAIFYPQLDGDREVKSDYSFLETCTFKDCELPVIVLDHTGEVYRYLVQPYFPESVAISPNGRVATFVGHKGDVHTFFNGGMHTLGGMTTDFAGGVMAVRDDGASAAVRIAPAYQSLDAQVYNVKNAELYRLPDTEQTGLAVGCAGNLWQFTEGQAPTLGKPTSVDEFAFDWASQAFTPITRPARSAITFPDQVSCTGEDGSFAFFQPVDAQAGVQSLWQWTKTDGFQPMENGVEIPLSSAEGRIMSLAVRDDQVHIARHNGEVAVYDRMGQGEISRFMVGEAFDQNQGFIHARIAFIDDKAYVVGKDKADPELWIAKRFDLASGKEELALTLPLLTENYLDRFLGTFLVLDRDAFDQWLMSQTKGS